MNIPSIVLPGAMDAGRKTGQIFLMLQWILHISLNRLNLILSPCIPEKNPDPTQWPFYLLSILLQTCLNLPASLITHDVILIRGALNVLQHFWLQVWMLRSFFPQTIGNNYTNNGPAHN